MGGSTITELRIDRCREEVEYVGKVNMNELYIQLPIMMAARLNLGKNYSASLSAGPYIA